MERSIAVRHANRAANAVFRSSGGPRTFSWLQCLGHEDAAPLAAFVVAHPQAPAVAFYQFAVRRERAPVQYARVPVSLALACETFCAVVLALEPRVESAACAEASARATASNVVDLHEARR